MPEPKRKTPPKPAGWRGLRRRTWIVLIFLESIALALLIAGLIKADPAAIIAALLIGLVYAPIRAGGWTLLRRLARRPADPAKAEDAFYGRRKR